MDPSDIRMHYAVLVAVITLILYRWLIQPLPPSSESKHIERKTTLKSKTYRVRGVPLDWNAEKLQSFLIEHTSYPVRVHSLFSEIRKPSSIGTVSGIHETRKNWNIPLPTEQHLALDDDFFGITTLYAPPPEDHRLEYAFSSFVEAYAN